VVRNAWGFKRGKHPPFFDPESQPIDQIELLSGWPSNRTILRNRTIVADGGLGAGSAWIRMWSGRGPGC
jgi:hypothetical protein